MSRAGRPSLPIWDQFDKITESGVFKAKCRHCGHIMANNSQRMNKHYISRHNASSSKMSLSEEEENSSGNDCILTKEQSSISGEIKFNKIIFNNF